jgi:hypothetical protein
MQWPHLLEWQRNAVLPSSASHHINHGPEPTVLSIRNFQFRLNSPTKANSEISEHDGVQTAWGCVHALTLGGNATRSTVRRALSRSESLKDLNAGYSQNLPDWDPFNILRLQQCRNNEFVCIPRSAEPVGSGACQPICKAVPLPLVPAAPTVGHQPNAQFSGRWFCWHKYFDVPAL